MNKLISSMFGLLILVGSGVLFVVLAEDIKLGDPTELPLCFGLIAALGWAYSVMHQQKYPIQVISIVYIAEIFLLIIFKDDLGERVVTESTVLLIISGVIFALSGPKLGQAIALSLSPLQRYLKSIGLNLSIHIIIGFIGLMFASVALFMIS